MAVLVLAGCSSGQDWYDPTTWWEEAEQATPQEEDLADSYPELADVPEKPPQTRKELRDKLIASDTRERRYIDQRSIPIQKTRSVETQPDITTARQSGQRSMLSTSSSNTVETPPIIDEDDLPESLETIPVQPLAPTQTSAERNDYWGSQGFLAREISPLGDDLGQQVSDDWITIQFGHGSSQLEASDQRKLQVFINQVKDKPFAKIQVRGHASKRVNATDPFKKRLANFSISMERSARVASFIINQGIAPTKVMVQSLSDHRPLLSENLPEGEVANRRVEVYLIR